MSKLNNRGAVAGMILLSLGAGSARGDGLTQVHPGYEMADIHPQGKQFLVGGLDQFSDGRLAVCNWGNPGEVWILGNALQGDKATVQPVRFAYGLQQVLGCKVVQDTLYVMQMGELTQLVDVDGDGKADRYNKVNDAFATSESLLGYAFDVLHFGGSFYAALSADVGWQGMSFKPPLPDRSSFIRMGRDNSIEYLATGFRNPNGMGLGFGNRMFATDNQGSWLPTSKLIHLEKGKFYGHRTEPANRFQDQPESPPLAWLPHNEVSFNPGNVLYLAEGLFRNQLLFAEQDKRLGGRIYRVSVQEVGGVLQGAIIPFSGGVGTGISRLALGKGNVLYAGLLGADGNWYGLSTMVPGLKRLRPKDVNRSFAFEILAVRSTGPATVELEFTSPPEAGAGDPLKFTAKTWTHVPEEAYGGGNRKYERILTVQAATLKPDGRTVELKIAGLAENHVLHIRLAGLKSAEGLAPWGGETWFTLNKFGPGKVPVVAGCMDAGNPAYDPAAAVNDPAACLTVPTRPGAALPGRAPLAMAGPGRIQIALPAGAPYDLRLFDLAGALRGEWHGNGPGEVELGRPDGLSRRQTGRLSGLHIVRLQSRNRVWSQVWLGEGR